MHISDPGDQGAPYEAQPAPSYILEDMLRNVAHLTPDITAADVTPAGLSDAVPVGEGYYVYNEPSRFNLTPSEVGLGHAEVIRDVDSLRERAQYDQLTLGGETGAYTVGSVDSLVDRALTDPLFLPVVRRHERRFEVGGMVGTHTYGEAVGVSYYPRDVLLPEPPYGVAVNRPEQEAMSMVDAREWSERLRRARRAREQSDGQEDV